MIKLIKRAHLLAEHQFLLDAPHANKLPIAQYKDIFWRGYVAGQADRNAEIRALISPTTAAPQAVPSSPTPNDTDAAGQPSILTQEIAQ